jgi:hypothetical protein
MDEFIDRVPKAASRKLPSRGLREHRWNRHAHDPDREEFETHFRKAGSVLL